jgi:hypothetical protein
MAPHVCKHDCGPRTPPRTLDLATSQSTCACGRPRQVRAPEQSVSLGSPSPREVTVVCELGFDLSLFACRT